MNHTCGCAVEPASLRDFCDAHRFAPCHVVEFSAPAVNAEPGECPPCWRRRMLSVNTGYATTRLGREREALLRPGIDPALEVRVAERDEFPSFLTEGRADR